MESSCNRHYVNTFLRQVIVRIDFSEFIDNSLFNDLLFSPINGLFPIKEMVQEVNFDHVSVQVKPDGQVESATNNRQTGRQYVFFDTAKLNSISISNMFVILDVKRYASFSNVIRITSEVVGSLYNTAKLKSNRIGLRYINVYPQSNFKMKQSYLNGGLKSLITCTLPASKYSSNVIRSIRTDEYIIGDMRLTYKSGMLINQFNPIISSDDFIIDIDCFTQEMVDSPDGILSRLKSAHDYINTLFEDSITDSLRGIMGYAE